MKTVSYMGRDFKVPTWAEYIAADDNGDVYAYDTAPLRLPGAECWRAKAVGRSECVGWLQTSNFPVISLK